MKVIVTGGAGFIGSNFVQHMVNKYPDYEIINLDLLTYAGNLENLKPVEDKPNYKFVKGDIADREFIFKLFEDEKPDVVVNFAAESHVDRSITDPEAFVRTNVMGTTTLLDACRTYGIKRYHQVSTDEVYGDLPLDRTGYLDRLYVGRDFQGRGIATAICRRLEEQFPVERVTVCASITARPFFEGRGYRVVRSQKVLRRGVYLTNFVMEKRLGESG